MLLVSGGAAAGLSLALVDIAAALARNLDSVFLEPALAIVLAALALLGAAVGATVGLVCGMLLCLAPHDLRPAISAAAIWGSRLPSVAAVLATLAVVGLALAVPSGLERHGKPGPLPTAKRPNVVLIVIDSLRQDVLETDSRTDIAPQLLKFAEEATVYNQHRSVGSWTRPSMSGLLTGRYPTELGTHDAGLPDAANTLAEHLHAMSYETVGISGNYFTSPKHGFAQGHDYYWQKSNVVILQSLHSRRWISKRAFRALSRKLRFHYAEAHLLNAVIDNWLVRRDSSRPFYLFLHYMDVHWPFYVYSETPTNWSNRSRPETFTPYYEIFERMSDSPRPPFADLSLPDPEVADLLARYYGGQQYVDTFIGKLFGRLRTEKLWENTLVIVTSDHGEEFFEHAFFTHGGNLYDESVRVPLIVKWPGRPVPRTVQLPVSALQVVPTILGAAGLQPNAEMLPPLKPDHHTSPDVVFSDFDRKKVDIVAAVSGKLKALYTRTEDGRKLRELYDLAADSGETRNLWSHETPQAHELFDALHRFASRLDSNPAAIRENPTEDGARAVRALGYLE